MRSFAALAEDASQDKDVSDHLIGAVELLKKTICKGGAENVKLGINSMARCIQEGHTTPCLSSAVCDISSPVLNPLLIQTEMTIHSDIMNIQSPVARPMGHGMPLTKRLKSNRELYRKKPPQQGKASNKRSCGFCSSKDHGYIQKCPLVTELGALINKTFVTNHLAIDLIQERAAKIPINDLQTGATLYYQMPIGTNALVVHGKLIGMEGLFVRCQCFGEHGESLTSQLPIVVYAQAVYSYLLIKCNRSKVILARDAQFPANYLS